MPDFETHADSSGTEGRTRVAGLGDIFHGAGSTFVLSGDFNYGARSGQDTRAHGGDGHAGVTAEFPPPEDILAGFDEAAGKKAKPTSSEPVLDLPERLNLPEFRAGRQFRAPRTNGGSLISDRIGGYEFRTADWESDGHARQRLRDANAQTDFAMESLSLRGTRFDQDGWFATTLHSEDTPKLGTTIEAIGKDRFLVVLNEGVSSAHFVSASEAAKLAPAEFEQLGRRGGSGLARTAGVAILAAAALNTLASAETKPKLVPRAK